MTTYYSIHFSPCTDQITEDGEELRQVPYPFHVNPNRTIMGQDFWQGDPTRVMGFARKLDIQELDLSWMNFLHTPQLAVGMYVVTANERGEFSTHLSAVSEVEVKQSPKE